MLDCEGSTAGEEADTQECPDRRVLVWLVPRNGAPYELQTTPVSVVRPVYEFTYVMRIDIRKVVKKPINLLGTLIRDELVECRNVGVRGFLDRAPECADTLVGLEISCQRPSVPIER